ncbi:hypothetical protein FQZ97_537990 [compost metagenome]
MLPAPSVKRSPATSSICPNGARSTPFCSITGASNRSVPPADKGSTEEFPERPTVMDSPDRIFAFTATDG